MSGRRGKASDRDTAILRRFESGPIDTSQWTRAEREAIWRLVDLGLVDGSTKVGQRDRLTAAGRAALKETTNESR